MGSKYIIFDLGGVLLDIHYKATEDAFRSLELKAPEKAFTKYHQSDLFQNFEKGLITDQAFIGKLKELMPKATEKDLQKAWCAMLGDLIDGRIELLEKLKSTGVPLYLLSNTNGIHQVAFEESIDATYGWERFEACFNGIYYSHRMGLRKPDPSIFREVMGREGLKAEAGLFIDDTIDHVLGARSCGMKAIHIEEPDELEKVIKLEGFIL